MTGVDQSCTAERRTNEQNSANRKEQVTHSRNGSRQKRLGIIRRKIRTTFRAAMLLKTIQVVTAFLTVHFHDANGLIVIKTTWSTTEIHSLVESSNRV